MKPSRRNGAILNGGGELLECRFLAKKRSSGQVASPSALRLTTDIQAAVSAFTLISSAVPLGADAQDSGADRPEVTQTGSR